MSLGCKLLRISDSGQWTERTEPATISILAVGVTIRDAKTNSLLGDYPMSTILSFRKVKAQLYRIQLNGRLEAVAVEMTHQTGDNLEKQLKENGIIFVDGTKSLTSNGIANGKTCLGTSLPSLDDDNTKIFVLEMLLSDDFEEFVESLQQMMEDLQRKIHP